MLIDIHRKIIPEIKIWIRTRPSPKAFHVDHFLKIVTKQTAYSHRATLKLFKALKIDEDNAIDLKMEKRMIRALYDNSTITVYQAYNIEIGQTAVEHQTFVSPPFKKERMTWIKPSFLWMMYRSGWATKENQECILAITITRDGFEWALENSCLSHYERTIYYSHEEWKANSKTAPVRIQWDPEKDIFLQPLPYRSIQIGLSGIVVEKYVSEWITRIDDVTKKCKTIHQLVSDGRINEAKDLLPKEQIYPLPESIALKINSF